MGRGTSSPSAFSTVTSSTVIRSADRSNRDDLGLRAGRVAAKYLDGISGVDADVPLAVLLTELVREGGLT